MTLGLLLWDAETRDGFADEGGYEASPHVWLDVDGAPVDNAYVMIPQSPSAGTPGYQTPGGLFFGRARNAGTYAKEDPFATRRRLYLGDQESGDGTVAHNLRVFR